MRKFLFTTTVFFIVVSLLLIMMDGLVSYKLSNNEFIERKRDLFSRNRQNYRSVFWGSSLTHRQIKPEIIDEVVQGKSYNFGLPDLVAFGKNNVFISMLEDGSFDGVDRIFLEYGTFYSSRMREWREGTLQSMYYYRSRDFIHELRFTLATAAPILVKLDRFSEIVRSYLLSRAKLYPLLKTQMSRETTAEPIANDGYQSLDSLPKNREKPSKRRKSLLKNPEILRSYKIISHKTFHENIRGAVTSSPISYYLSLIERCRQKKIMLYLVFYPKTASLNCLDETYYLPDIITQLPKKHVINFADLSKIPELLELRYNYDRTHFNDAGASLFSRYVAEEIHRLQQ